MNPFLDLYFGLCKWAMAYPFYMVSVLSRCGTINLMLETLTSNEKCSKAYRELIKNKIIDLDEVRKYVQK